MIDPYVVRCPVCLADPGERCTNRIRTLDSVHLGRHRQARRQRSRPVDTSGRPRAGEPPALAGAGRGARGRSG